MDNYILVRQKRSKIKKSRVFQKLLKDLGLNSINKKIFIRNDYLTRKKIFKVQHLISILNKFI